MNIKELVGTSLSLFLPRLCFSCEIKITHGVLCKQCQDLITYLTPPLCRICSGSLSAGAGTVCTRCRDKQPAYDRLICACAYSGPIEALIRLHKFKHIEYLHEFLCDILIARLKKIGCTFAAFDAIIPVPMHNQKLKERGFNQSLLLAHALSNHFKIKLCDTALHEDRVRLSQTKLTAERRALNTERVFVVKKTKIEENVILVDDVFTTGATLNACARALKENGARTVAGITLAKTLKSPDRNKHR